MDEARITLSGLWAALMLTYLLGDVMRIFAGDFEAGKIGGKEASQWMWMLATLVMLIPIVMIVLSLTVSSPAMRWGTVIASGFLVLSNLAGLPYSSMYDNFPIAVSCDEGATARCRSAGGQTRSSSLAVSTAEVREVTPNLR